MFVIKGPIVIDISKKKKHELLIKQYNLSFCKDDTLNSLKEELSKARKHYQQLCGKYDILKRKAQLAIHNTVKTKGGTLANLALSEDESAWIANLLVETRNDDGVVLTTNYTIRRAVMIKKRHHALKESIFAQASLEKRLTSKVQIVQDVYIDELKAKLSRSGDGEISRNELYRALKESHWDLEKSYDYVCKLRNQL